MDTKITFAKRINFTKFGLMTKSLDEIIDIIRCGDLELYDADCGHYTLKMITEAIRNEHDPQRQNEWKARFLPIVTFNGIWDGVKISAYSNITALDFDHISTDKQLEETLFALKKSPSVLAIFRTFKSLRVKALIIHDNTNPTKHKEMYEQLIAKFGLYGMDESCKDLSRKTYLSWDKDIWLNPNCTPFHFVPSQVSLNPKPISKTIIGKSKSAQSIVNILNTSWLRKHPEYWQKGNRANSIFTCACQFCLYGVPQDMAEYYFLNGGWISDDFEEDEILKHVRGAYNYNKNQYGSKEFI